MMVDAYNRDGCTIELMIRVVRGCDGWRHNSLF